MSIAINDFPWASAFLPALTVVGQSPNWSCAPLVHH